MIVTELFQLVVYQPFLNILVGIYWMLGLVTNGHPDMGVAVIFLTLVIRVLLLPMSIAGQKSEEERREIARKVAELDQQYEHDPITLRKEKKQLFRKSGRVIIGETFSLFVQVAIALMLWRIFETGLSGQDLHLIYDFMPRVKQPFNLTFLGQFDLTHTSWTLNILQSITIFIFETVSILTSPYPPSRGEVVRQQLTLPLVSFLIFMRLPAGKKLFVITALCFSIVVALVRYVMRKFEAYRLKVEAEEAKVASGEQEEEKVVVAIKE